MGPGRRRPARGPPARPRVHRRARDAGAAPRAAAPGDRRAVRTRATARRSSRPCSPRSPRWLRPPRRPWCSTTCSGPTTRRASSCPCWPPRAPTSRCSCSRPTARRRSRAGIRCAPPATPCAGPARCARWSCSPLDPDGTRALAGRVLGEPVADAVAVRLHARSGGVPFAVLELAAAIAGGADADAPLPETLREAVLSGLSGVPAEARAALEQAAALGVRFDLRLLVGLAGEAAVLAALDAGPLEEDAPGEAAFRHALVREAVLADVPWPRRRGLHERAATALAASGAPAVAVAEQWLAARRTDEAGPALAAAARESLAMYAARDALALAQRALSAGTPDPALERELLELAGRGAEQCGELEAAHDAWRAVAERAPTAGARIEALQHLAGVLELRGEWQRALDTRLVAADALSTSDDPATRRANGCAWSASARAAACSSRRWRSWSRRAPRRSRAATRYAVARALGFEGQIRGKLGEHERGLALVRQALTLALEHDGPCRVPPRRTPSSRSCWPTARTTAAPPTRTARRTRCARHAASRARATCAWRASATSCARAATGTARSRSAPRCPPTRRPTPSSRPRSTSPRCASCAARRARAGRSPSTSSPSAATRTCRWVRSRAAGSSRWPTRPTGERTPRTRSAGRSLARLADTDDRHYVVPVLRWTATFMGERGAADAVRAVRRGALGARRRVAPAGGARRARARARRARAAGGGRDGRRGAIRGRAGRARPPGGALGSRADRAAGGRRTRGGG